MTLSLEFKAAKNQLHYTIHYDAKHPEWIMQQMSDHFQNLINKFIQQPNSKIFDISCMSDDELNKILYEWNDTAADYPRDKTIHQLFEEQVERTPGNVAVVFEDQKLTYIELNQRANQLAHYLRKIYQEKFDEELKPDTLIAICVERSLEMIIGILGVLKAGGAYVPIDPGYPEERIGFMLQDTVGKILLTQSRLKEKIQNVNAEIYQILLDEEVYDAKAVENLKSISSPKDLAYVIYTSGSTGKPKGVLVEHSGIVNLAFAEIQRFLFDQQTRTLCFASFGFDAFTFEIYPTLFVGGSLYMTLKEKILPGELLASTLEKNEISFIVLPPSALQLTTLNAKHLQTIVVAGEACNKQLLLSYKDNYSFVNAYGPTETTVCATMMQYDRSESDLVSIGGPIENVQVYVLSKHHQPLPINVPGELYIGSDGLARGYLNRSELTKERFIKNPFSKDKNSRLYKTGDLVRWLPDGNLEFLDRIDDQIKIRGFRVELGEIEAIISKLSTIKHSIVKVFEKDDQKQLVAYYVKKKNGSISALEIKTELSKYLPNYMVPAAFVKLDKLPVTPNGKVDRKALPEPSNEDLIYNEYVAPESEHEEIVVNTLSNVLHVPNIGVNDNFFYLGGDSITAMQAVSYINQHCKASLSVNNLFQNPLIRDFANLLEVKKQKGCISKINKSSYKDYFPLSFAQELIWLHEQFANGLPIYNESLVITINCSVNILILEKSINELLKRHQMLRASIELKNNTPMQKINCFKPTELFQIDMSNLCQEEQVKCVADLTNREARKTINLADDSLIKFFLIKLNKEKYKLFIVIHHIVFDGLSVYNILVKELEITYKSLLKNKPPVLPELPIQYQDFVFWERKFLLKSINEDDKRYWKERLTNLPVLTLPTNSGNISSFSFHGSMEYSVFSAKLKDSLENLSKNKQVTFFILVLTAFKVLLSRYTGQDDIVVGTVVHGRDYINLNKILGNFLNMIVLRSDLSSCNDFQQTLERVATSTYGAYRHQHVPFHEVLKIFNAQGRQSRRFPFQVAFIYEPNFHVGCLGWEVSQLEAHPGTSKFDLTFELDKRADGLIVKVEYNTELFGKNTIQQMLQHYQLLLEKVVEKPNFNFRQLSLLTKQEKQKILHDWNNTTVLYPKDKTIHQLFEEQVKKTPDNIAVVFGDQCLTYKELNQKANQVAHYLRNIYQEKYDEELKPDDLIPLCLERGLELIIGIVGILKSGGVYVPMDPTYPEDRLQAMMEDSKARVIITKKNVLEKIAFLSEISIEPICLDIDWKQIRLFSLENPKIINGSTDLAYIIFTSGSTGKSKGVLLTHKTITNLISWQFQWNQKLSEKIMQFASLNFDVSLQEIFSALLNGCELHLISDRVKHSLQELINCIVYKKITKLFLPSSFLEHFCRECLISDLAFYDLKQVTVAGSELIITKNILGFFKKYRNISLVNHYGPSETHVVTCFELVSDPEFWAKKPPIGKPISNTQAYVLNKHLQPLPINVTGELYIGGDGLARGYLNRPELTKEKFIKNTFSKDKNSRLYKTGDLVRWLPDGDLEFLGRIDDQVKVRGFRIELGEIETHLGKHSGISQSVVLAKKDDHGNNYLVGYLVPANDADIQHHQVRQHLHQALPSYMIPEQFITLERLPLTPNGKVDKKALSAFQHQVLVEPALPASSLEMDIAEVLRELTQKDEIDTGRNFFEMGLHSFLVVQSSNILNTKLQINLKPIDIFTYPTVRSLAEYVNKTTAQPRESLVQSNGDKLDKKKKYLANRKLRHGRD